MVESAQVPTAVTNAVLKTQTVAQQCDCRQDANLHAASCKQAWLILQGDPLKNMTIGVESIAVLLFAQLQQTAKNYVNCAWPCSSLAL